MVCFNHLNLFMNKQRELRKFLHDRDLPIELIVAKIGELQFAKFIGELVLMDTYLAQAIVAAEKKGDANLVGDILGRRAMVQKDRVYLTLMHKMSLAEDLNLSYMGVLRDYILGRYNASVNSSIAILEGNRADGI